MSVYHPKQRKAPWTLAFPPEPKVKRPKPLKVRKRIRPRSARMSRFMESYGKRKLLFLADHPKCPVTGKQATEIHHVRGRAGRLLLDERFWLAVSRKGHKWIHDHLSWAQAHGWIASAGEWGKQQP